MKKVLIFWVICFQWLTLAQAQTLQPGAFEIGPYVGYGFLDEYAGAKPKDNLLYGVRLGLFMTDKVSFEPSYHLLFTETDTTPSADLKLSILRFNLTYNFLSSGKIIPFITGGLGWHHSDFDPIGTVFPGGTTNDLGLNTGLGLRIFLTEAIAVRLDGRFEYAEIKEFEDRIYNYEGTLGLVYLFGGKPPLDSDKDGVKDKKDKCADTPSGAKVDLQGCPTDSDGDGVWDGIDQCEKTLKAFVVDEKGCPKDTDGDSVPDGPDQCPDTPKQAPVDPQGCPLDKDKDGVFDPLDKCPDTVAGTVVNEEGCPADADGDGVLENTDLCPNTPVGTKVDEKGCPLQVKSRGILKGVAFKSGSAELTAPSLVILDGVAKELQEFPKVRVEVQGHTDSTGPAEVNLKLSEARAQSVVTYLISKGVEKERLLAHGFGSTNPIADNKTKLGRSQNRRVELKWLD